MPYMENGKPVDIVLNPLEYLWDEWKSNLETHLVYLFRTWRPNKRIFKKF